MGAGIHSYPTNYSTILSIFILSFLWCCENHRLAPTFFCIITELPKCWRLHHNASPPAGLTELTDDATISCMPWKLIRIILVNHACTYLSWSHSGPFRHDGTTLAPSTTRYCQQYESSYWMMQQSASCNRIPWRKWDLGESWLLLPELIPFWSISTWRNHNCLINNTSL
jgi:hypothetical protein